MFPETLNFNNTKPGKSWICLQIIKFGWKQTNLQNKHKEILKLTEYSKFVAKIWIFNGEGGATPEQTEFKNIKHI